MHLSYLSHLKTWFEAVCQTNNQIETSKFFKALLWENYQQIDQR